MKQLYVFFCLLFFVAVNNTLAQTGTIRGSVKTAEGTPLESANVSLEGSTKGAATDRNGSYQIDNVPVGEYDLSISAVGFERRKTKLKVSANQVTTMPK